MRGHNRLCKDRCAQRKCNETQDLNSINQKGIITTSLKSLNKSKICSRSQSVIERIPRGRFHRNDSKETVKFLQMNTEKLPIFEKSEPQDLPKISTNKDSRNKIKVVKDFKTNLDSKIALKRKITSKKSKELLTKESTLNISGEPYAVVPKMGSKRVKVSKSYISIAYPDEKDRSRSPNPRLAKSQKKRSQSRPIKRGIPQRQVRNWLDEK